jgi:hypothetical protein
VRMNFIGEWMRFEDRAHDGRGPALEPPAEGTAL